MDAGQGVLATTGSFMAHVRLRSAADIDHAALTELVRKAVRLTNEKGDLAARADAVAGRPSDHTARTAKVCIASAKTGTARSTIWSVAVREIRK